MICPMCQGKCCRDVDSGYRVEHMAAEVYLHACDCADGTWVNPDAEALDEVTAEARRLSTAVDRLEGESLEVLAALGLHEDTSLDDALAHIRTLVQEHAEMRLAIEGRRKRADLDDLLARVEQGARDVEQAKIVAWLRYLASHGTRITPQKEKLLSDVCDALERGAHLKGERAHLDELLARVEQGARAVERDEIVAWLRRNPGKSRAPECITAMTPFEVADAIERGEHRKGGNHD